MSFGHFWEIRDREWECHSKMGDSKVPASYHLYIFFQLNEKILSLKHFAFFFYVRTCHSYQCDVNNADRKRAPDKYQYNSGAVKYSTEIY